MGGQVMGISLSNLLEEKQRNVMLSNSWVFSKLRESFRQS